MAVPVQDVIVTIICAIALLLIGRRLFAAVRPKAAGTPCAACPKCETASAAAAEPPRDVPRPMVLIRSSNARTTR